MEKSVHVQQPPKDIILLPTKRRLSTINPQLRNGGSAFPVEHISRRGVRNILGGIKTVLSFKNKTGTRDTFWSGQEANFAQKKEKTKVLEIEGGKAGGSK